MTNALADGSNELTNINAPRNLAEISECFLQGGREFDNFVAQRQVSSLLEELRLTSVYSKMIAEVLKTLQPNLDILAGDLRACIAEHVSEVGMSAAKKYREMRLRGEKNDLDSFIPGIKIYLTGNGLKQFNDQKAERTIEPEVVHTNHLGNDIWEVILPKGTYQRMVDGPMRFYMIWRTSGMSSEQVDQLPERIHVERKDVIRIESSWVEGKEKEIKEGTLEPSFFQNRGFTISGEKIPDEE